MAGGKKKGTGNYLLLHRSGAVARTKTLKTPQPIEGITAIINLETLEQYTGDHWEEIPDGCEALIAAEEEEISEEERDEEDLSPLVLQVGARRCFNPHVVWAYCKVRD